MVPLLAEPLKTISLMTLLLVFRRRGRGANLRPINRIKHVVDIQGGLVAGANTFNDLITANDSPVLANTREVETGSTVNGIYLKVEVYATGTAALANCYMAVYKDPGGNLAAISPNAVGISDNKRYVIHQEMVMMEKNTTGNPRTLMNGVIVIPRGYRRFGPNDVLKIVLLSVGVTADFCVQCHYKEFR